MPIANLLTGGLGNGTFNGSPGSILVGGLGAFNSSNSISGADMFPPIFEVCSIDTDVQSIFGSTPCRLYPFGEAPQNVIKPYAVWQLVSGAPENYLDRVPDVDQFTIQIDVYANTVDASRIGAKVLRNVIQDYAYITVYTGDLRDPSTDNYRYTFSVDWFVHRL